MVRSIHLREPRKASVRPPQPEASGAFSAAVRVGSEMERSAGHSRFAIVPWLRVRAHGTARSLSGPTGPWSRLFGWVRRNACGITGRRNRNAAEEPRQGCADRALSLFDAWAEGTSKVRAARWIARIPVAEKAWITSGHFRGTNTSIGDRGD